MNAYLILARNGIWLMIGRFGAQLMLAVSTLVLVHRLGLAVFGEYALMTAVVLIASIITTFGTDMYLIRRIAAEKDYEQISEALLVQLLLSVLVIGILWLLAEIPPYLRSSQLVALRIFSLALIPLAMFSIFTAIIRGEERMRDYTVLNLSINLIQLMAIWLFIPAGMDIRGVAAILLAVQILSTAIAGWFCHFPIRKYLKLSWKITKGAAHLFGSCAPIAIIAGMRTLYQRASLVMLSMMSGSIAGGWFSASSRVVETARLGHGAVFTAIFPMMARSVGQEADYPEVHFKLPLVFLIAAAGLLTVLLYIFAPLLIITLFGEAFRPSIKAVQILAFTFVPYVINDFLSITLLAHHLEKILVWILSLSVLSMILANIWVIPQEGFLGASWVILLIESLQTIVLILAWRFNFALPASKICWNTRQWYVRFSCFQG